MITTQKITLKAARVNAGLTQEAICKRCHVSKTTVVRWEKGLARPRPLELEKLLRLYGFSEEDLLLPEKLS